MKESDEAETKILIVEDEPVICDLCQRVLSGEGRQIDIALNGKVAQGLIENREYNLILLDIRTPVMNGIELYHWLQEKHPRLTGKTILTTGSVMSKNTTTFIEQTGRPFLPKPFTPDELKAIVDQVLKKRGQ